MIFAGERWIVSIGELILLSRPALNMNEQTTRGCQTSNKFQNNKICFENILYFIKMSSADRIGLFSKF